MPSLTQLPIRISPHPYPLEFISSKTRAKVERISSAWRLRLEKSSLPGIFDRGYLQHRTARCHRVFGLDDSRALRRQP
jgi:hypothetical protein